MSEKTTFQVDYLIAVSRFTERFYALVHRLTGKDAVYQNPGVALRSFVIAKCFKDELVTIGGETLENLRACEEFGTNYVTISITVQEVLKQGSLVMAEVSADPRLSSEFIRELTHLAELMSHLRSAFDSFTEKAKPGENDGRVLQPFSPEALKFKQALYTVSDQVRELHNIIDVAGTNGDRA